MRYENATLRHEGRDWYLRDAAGRVVWQTPGQDPCNSLTSHAVLDMVGREGWRPWHHDGEAGTTWLTRETSLREKE